MFCMTASNSMTSAAPNGRGSREQLSSNSPSLDGGTDEVDVGFTAMNGAESVVSTVVLLHKQMYGEANGHDIRYGLKCNINKDKNYSDIHNRNKQAKIVDSRLQGMHRQHLMLPRISATVTAHVS
jgi:hypothetical protein